MKKLLFAIVFLAQCIILNAQTNLSEAVDFECVDIDGDSIHLFDILDRGKSVLIDFFSVECGGCQQTMPSMVEAYPYFGCNLHDLFIMGISYTDNDSALIQWREDNSVDFPIIGKEGGGNAVFSAYGIKVCPSIILIKPDHSIPIKTMFPFSLTDVVDQVIPHNIFSSDCTVKVCETPSDLTANYSDEAVSLVWNSSLWANSYAVFRDGELIENVSDTLFLDYNIGEDIEYCYYVAAICEEDEMSPPSNEECVTIPVNDTNSYQRDIYTLYPNPTSGRTLVKGPKMNGIKVYNPLGQKVYEVNAPGDYYRMDFSHCETGVYIVQLSTEAQIRTLHVVVIR